MGPVPRGGRREVLGKGRGPEDLVQPSGGEWEEGRSSGATWGAHGSQGMGPCLTPI